MYRAFILCSCLLINNSANATIYQWVDHKGVINYGQTQPQRQAITPDKIILKVQKRDNTKEEAPESVVDSVNTIAESNAKRKEEKNKKALAAQEKRQLQKNCIASKKNLANLNYGNNRLHKDSKGNYTRLTPADREQKRKKLRAYIKENCR